MSIFGSLNLSSLKDMALAKNFDANAIDLRPDLLRVAGSYAFDGMCDLSILLENYQPDVAIRIAAQLLRGKQSVTPHVMTFGVVAHKYASIFLRPQKLNQDGRRLFETIKPGRRRMLVRGFFRRNLFFRSELLERALEVCLNSSHGDEEVACLMDYCVGLDRPMFVKKLQRRWKQHGARVLRLCSYNFRISAYSMPSKLFSQKAYCRQAYDDLMSEWRDDKILIGDATILMQQAGLLCLTVDETLNAQRVTGRSVCSGPLHWELYCDTDDEIRALVRARPHELYFYEREMLHGQYSAQRRGIAHERLYCDSMVDLCIPLVQLGVSSHDIERIVRYVLQPKRVQLIRSVFITSIIARIVRRWRERTRYNPAKRRRRICRERPRKRSYCV